MKKICWKIETQIMAQISVNVSRVNFSSSIELSTVNHRDSESTRRPELQGEIIGKGDELGSVCLFVQSPELENQELQLLAFVSSESR